jgi:hypothetical protein
MTTHNPEKERQYFAENLPRHVRRRDRTALDKKLLLEKLNDNGKDHHLKF